MRLEPLLQRAHFENQWTRSADSLASGFQLGLADDKYRQKIGQKEESAIEDLIPSALFVGVTMDSFQHH